MIDLEGVSPCPLFVEATDLWSVSAWKIDVRLGSKAEVSAGQLDVCFTPESGHR
jgi:hypothetical protein